MNKDNIPVYCLTQLADYDYQYNFTRIEPVWNSFGFTLKKSIIPEQKQFKDGTFSYGLYFDGTTLKKRALYYGLTNALAKGRNLDEPFIIISSHNVIVAPIDLGLYENIGDVMILGKDNFIDNGLIIKPNAADKLFKLFLNTMIDNRPVNSFISDVCKGNNINFKYSNIEVVEPLI